MNRLNKRICSASGMPTPWSLIATRPNSAVWSSITVNSVPDGEYLMAFDSRLLRIIWMRSGSPTTLSSPGNGSNTKRWPGGSSSARTRSTACSATVKRSTRSERSRRLPSSSRATSTIWSTKRLISMVFASSAGSDRSSRSRLRSDEASRNIDRYPRSTVNGLRSSCATRFRKADFARSRSSRRWRSSCRAVMSRVTLA